MIIHLQSKEHKVEAALTALSIQSSCISHLYLPMLKNGCNFIEKQLPLSGVWKPLHYLSCTGSTSALAPSNIYPLEL